MTFETSPEQLNSPQDSSPDSVESGCPCSEANEHVWDYLDGELSEQDCARIKEHLGTCGECRDQYNSELKLKEVISRSCGCDEVPITLRAEITLLVARLRRESCK